jgi:hypothetical protein
MFTDSEATTNASASSVARFLRQLKIAHRRQQTAVTAIAYNRLPNTYQKVSINN